MTQSFFQLYVHLVWHTKYRRPVLRDQLDELVHSEIRNRLDNNDLLPLAVGSAWDHVHVFAGWNGKTSVADFVGNVKGAASYRWNNEVKPDDTPRLEWQAGYGAISIERRNIKRVTRYIDFQKQQHRRGEIWERLEKSSCGEL